MSAQSSNDEGVCFWPNVFHVDSILCLCACLPVVRLSVCLSTCLRETEIISESLNVVYQLQVWIIKALKPCVCRTWTKLTHDSVPVRAVLLLEFLLLLPKSLLGEMLSNYFLVLEKWFLALWELHAIQKFSLQTAATEPLNKFSI
jgi:hypothetical protein